MSTEGRNPASMDFDRMSAVEIVETMAREEYVVLGALEVVSSQVAAAAQRVAEVHDRGGRVFLIGAGTSGRLAVQEAAELPPTFGVAEDAFVPLIASGPTGGPAAIARSEDDTDAIIEVLSGLQCGPEDGLIGLAASGSTPFVVAGLEHARSVGAWTCAASNNSPAPILGIADLGIFLDTGPELITGSTRMKAGTSQKLLLNRITTTAMVLCGKVISNLMVEVRPANAKLRDRCIRIVDELTGSGLEVAESLLERSEWSIRKAVDLSRS